MEKRFRYTRQKLMKIINKCRISSEGVYWCPFLIDLIELEGEISDDEYFYPREIFYKKMYFSEEDLEIFLSKTEKKLEINEYMHKNLNFYYTNQDILNLEIYDKINNLYTISELLDMYEFKYVNNYEN